MVGPALLVSPILDQGATTVQAYFPAATWYNYHTGAKTGDSTKATTVALPAPISSPINIHLRGGYIVPTQKGLLTTTLSRVSPFTIVVGLDGAGQAAGQLYLDDGESLTTDQDKSYTIISYKAAAGTFSNSIVSNGYSGATSLTLEKVVIYGVQGTVSAVKINGTPTSSFTVSATSLTVTGFGSLAINKPVTVQWA